MFLYVKHGGESPPGHPTGACPPGTGGMRRGLAGRRARSGLCGRCQGRRLPSATAALPPDDQSFLANANCAVLRLLSYVRRMVGVPNTSVIDLCDELGTPKLLFQVTSLNKRASEFLQAHGTYYVCGVEFRARRTEEEHWCWSFTPLLEHPSPALTEALQLQGKHVHRRQTGAPQMPEERRTPDTETLPSMAQGQGVGKASGRGPGRAGTEGTRCKAASPPERGRGRASRTGGAGSQ
ncbi:LOW QUALITY PROTEIN: uncharacterized protein CXorf65 homolog [Ciconia boyciana]|uniref:LOW QUALITY PROTEIN: uncharacterized protein CXorf65 homolog n=1 Tax=Ciconia boyciana TaxID=52775 RepID=UPI003B9E0578